MNLEFIPPDAESSESSARRPPQSTLFRNATLLTMGPSCRVLEKASLLVEQGRIADFRGGDILYDSKSTRVVEASGRVLIPGLINAHTHLYSSLARGMPPPCAAPRNFREILERVWWRLDKALDHEITYWSALAGLADSLRHGVTTLFDHHASPFACEGSLDVIERAVRAIGLRGCLCYEVSDRDGMEIAQQGILENARFLEKCRAGGLQVPDRQIQGLFGLHASFTLSNATLEKARSSGAHLPCGYHIHVAEDLCDVNDAAEKYRSTVTARLERFGILNPRTIAAHGVHLAPEELPALAASGSCLAHNPQSNSNNAVGMADLGRLLAAGVRVGLGTDGFTPRLFDEIRAVFTLQKQLRHDPAAAWQEAYQLAFVENPRLASEVFGIPLGRLEKGAAADLVLLNYLAPTPLTADNFLGHLYFGLVNAAVDSVMVGGHWLLQHGLLTMLDEAELAAKTREAAARLWSRMEDQP